MRRSTLPLSSLRAFEAAARQLSFKTAAEELGVTPAAISFQIKSLEALVDVELFVRKPRRVELTSAGKSLFASVENALDEISTALDRIASGPQPKTVTLGTDTLLATRWLCPRLAQFWQMYPEIGLRIRHLPTTADLRAHGTDLSIVWGAGGWPNAEHKILLSTRMTPVCSPEMLKEAGPIQRPEQLANVPLIHQRDFDDWAQWLEAAGGKSVDPASGSVIDDPNAALQAAIDGRGVTMGHLPLIDEDLRAGRLVCPFELIVEPDSAYYLVCPNAALARSELRILYDWLLGESRTVVDETTYQPEAVSA